MEHANHPSDLLFIDEGSNRETDAFHLLEEEHNEEHFIKTFSSALDNLLQGGFKVGQITEVCGAAGCGKTQLCFQLCVDVQYPVELGGLGKEALYIDCEGDFNTDRIQEIAAATIRHAELTARREGLDTVVETIAKDFTCDTILSRIHHTKCQGAADVVSLVTKHLPTFITQHPNIGVIVLDSIACHFRNEFDDYAFRLRLLYQLLHSFLHIITSNKLAVVICNQMTTKFAPAPSHPGRPSDGMTVPALGDSWAHMCNTRLLLERVEDVNTGRFLRSAQLLKSPYAALPTNPQHTTAFQILKCGIRDVVQPQTHSKKRPSEGNATGISSYNHQFAKKSPNILQ